MFENYIDSKLNVKEPAYDVLGILKRKAKLPRNLAAKVSYAETSAWYNGRERGLSLVIHPMPNAPSLAVVWAECRNSDSIVVYTWRGNFFNPPSVSDMTDAIYHAGEYFGPDDADKVADYIHNAVVAFLKKIELAKTA